MEPVLIYISILERFLLYGLPILAIYLGFRRFLMSRSFNRVLYAIVVLNALAALIALSRLDDADAILSLLARAMAYCTIPIWWVVTDACRDTGTSAKYGDDWITVYRKPDPSLANTAPPAIERDPWANPPDSPALPVVPFTPSGPVVATRAGHGTPSKRPRRSPLQAPVKLRLERDAAHPSH